MPSPAASAASILAIMSLTVAWYSDACSGVRLHQTFISSLSGRSEMIVLSVFSRRRMNGPVIRCSRSAASSSPLRSIGTANLVRNRSAGPSSPGRTNSMIDHRSAEPVLDRRAGQRDPGLGGQGAHRPGLAGGRVLDVLRLVADHPGPLDLARASWSRAASA